MIINSDNTHTGIILKKNETLLTILSTQEGKTEKYIFIKERNMHGLYQGTIINYNLTHLFFKSKNIIQNIFIQTPSTHLASHNIVLLHAFIEVSFFFIYWNDVSTSISNFLIDFLQQNINFSFSKLQTKFFLCKIFSLLALYPDDHIIHNFSLYLHSIPIDKCVEASLQLSCEKSIDTWLRWCIEIHPKKEMLTVLPLLLKK